MRMLKRVVATVLCVALMLSVTVTAVAAEVLTEGDFTYTINADGATVTITDYTGSDVAVVIPEQIADMAVTAIGNGAFQANSTITSVSLPTTLEVIESNAFSTCTALTAISIPDAVVSIGAMAFYNCLSLETIDISPYTYDIGYQAFHNTLWLSKSNNGVLYLGRVLYTYVGTMPQNYNLVVKNGTAAIAPYAFDGQYNLREVYLPMGIRIIGACAFLDCTMMSLVRIPPSVISMDNGVFLGAPATTVKGVRNSLAHTCANESDLYFQHDATLDYPDGDMNRDGIVNTADFRTALQAVLDPTKNVDVERFYSCDIIYDGVITTSDVRELMRKSLGLI